MFEEIRLRYFHPGYNIGVQDIKNVWLLSDPPIQLKVSLHRGSLIYRLPGTQKRISYTALKKGLIKENKIIRRPVYLLPF